MQVFEIKEELEVAYCLHGRARAGLFAARRPCEKEQALNEMKAQAKRIRVLTRYKRMAVSKIRREYFAGVAA